MRKIIVFNMITLDGMFEGPNADISFHRTDEEFNQFAIEQLSTIDTIIFGRVTYEGMASYWTTPEAAESDPVVTNQMNSIRKIVFSTTLDTADWNNTRLIRSDVANTVRELKQQTGKDMIIFGSAKLVASFAELGLIDEYRLIIVPTLLGQGTPLFKDMQQNLRLSNSRVFANGNVLLCYQPEV
ncbi:MAG: dihydrofolate reductase family protein [Anaerolineae bacterium]|nr:dihydrofolate reductase [Anaerolineae bacterium]